MVVSNGKSHLAREEVQKYKTSPGLRTLVEFMYLVFICISGESHRRQLRSLLCLCDAFRVPITPLFLDCIQMPSDRHAT